MAGVFQCGKPAVWVRLGPIVCVALLALVGSGCATHAVYRSTRPYKIPARYGAVKKVVLQSDGMLNILTAEEGDPGTPIVLRIPLETLKAYDRISVFSRRAAIDRDAELGEGESIQVIGTNWEDLRGDTGLMLKTPKKPSAYSTFFYRYLDPAHGKPVTRQFQILGKNAAKRPWYRMLYFVSLPVDAVLIVVTSPVTLYLGFMYWLHGPA